MSDHIVLRLSYTIHSLVLKYAGFRILFIIVLCGLLKTRQTDFFLGV